MQPWWQPVVLDFERRVRTFLVMRAQIGKRDRIASTVRTIVENARVGGETNSQHLVGTAADLVPLDGDFASLYRDARASGLFGYVGDESRRIGHGAHIHLQLVSAGRIPQSVYDLVAS